MDEILIRRLEVSCIIGVNDWERISPQRLLISVSLHTSITGAAADDALTGTIDYVAACRLVQQIAQQGRFKLIETLAEKLAEALLALNGAQRVSVEVLKPGAVREAESVGVRIVRPTI